MCEYEQNCAVLPWVVDFYSSDNGRVPNYQLKAAFADNNIKHNANLNVESKPFPKRLTRIMCTIGQTSSKTNSTFRDMMEAGMSVALLKSAFHTTPEWRNIISTLNEAIDMHSRKIGRIYPLAIGLELRGCEIRTGILKNFQIQSEISLKKGNFTSLTTDPAYEEHVTEDMIYVDYQKITEIVVPGDSVYLDNKINLSALEIVGNIIKCLIETAGNLASRASVSIPSVPIELPLVTEKDEEDIFVCIKDKVNMIILPGMRNQDNIQKYREAIGPEGKSIYVIPKIDNLSALANIDELIKASDGIMLDRDVLSVELPQEKLFLIQKSIIAKCNLAGKPIICGPNMLETMTNENRPSRAELLDVANVILDGVDCLQLSKETLNGQHVVDTLCTLNSICKEAEAATYQKQVFNNLSCNTKSPIEVVYTIGIATVETAIKCNAAAIIVLTSSGKTAKIIARFRPRCPIVAITSILSVAKQLQLYRGLDPIYYIKSRAKSWREDSDRRIQLGVTYGKYTGFIRAGDAIVIASGTRPSSGFTNYLKVVYASDFDSVPNECICNTTE